MHQRWIMNDDRESFAQRGKQIDMVLAVASGSENAATATQLASLGGFGLLAAVSAAPAARVFDKRFTLRRFDVWINRLVVQR